MADVPFNNTNIKPSDISLLDIVKAIKNGTEYETRMTNLNDFFGDNISITFSQINGDPYTNGNPIKSSVANTATTFVAPLQLQTIWRWNIQYYVGA